MFESRSIRLKPNLHATREETFQCQLGHPSTESWGRCEIIYIHKKAVTLKFRDIYLSQALCGYVVKYSGWNFFVFFKRRDFHSRIKAVSRIGLQRQLKIHLLFDLFGRLTYWKSERHQAPSGITYHTPLSLKTRSFKCSGPVLYTWDVFRLKHSLANLFIWDIRISM